MIVAAKDNPNTRHLDDGALPIDNNISEQLMRQVALGRNYADLRIMRSRLAVAECSLEMRL